MIENHLIPLVLLQICQNTIDLVINKLVENCEFTPREMSFKSERIDLEMTAQLSSINDFTDDNKDEINLSETEQIEFADTSNHIINIV